MSRRRKQPRIQLRPSFFQRWFRSSETIAWGYFKVLSGTVLLGIHELGDFVTNPAIKSYIDEVNFPAYVCSGLAIIGLVTLAVRMRKGSSDPV